MSSRSIGVLNCVQPKAKTTNRAPAIVRARSARDAPVARPPREHPSAEVTMAVPPSVERFSIYLTKQEEEERQLVPRKRHREETPPAGATPTKLTMEPQITALPLIMKRPHTSGVYLEEMAVADAETPRGKPFFGRDPEKAERVLLKDPSCPPMVVDFFSTRVPRDRTEIPTYLTRALDSMPKAWTTDLDVIAARRNPDAMQACFALSLQTAVMDDQAAREAEVRPSVTRLQADLEVERKTSAEFADRVVSMENELLAARKKASQEAELTKRANDRLKTELIEDQKSFNAMTKEAASQLVAAKDRAEVAEKEAGQAAERAVVAEKRTEAAEEKLAVNVPKLEGVKAELAAMKAEEEANNANHYNNLGHAAEFAYYMAYSDALRAAKKGGMDVGPLLEAFKAFTAERPLDPFFTIPILDLTTEYGIDLSRYPRFDCLRQPDSAGDDDEEEEEEEEAEGGEDRAPQGGCEVPEAEGGDQVPLTGEPSQP